LWLNNETGAKNRAFEVLTGVNDIFEGRAIPFGKASSLGDIVTLCTPGPMEIGNRVWLDKNGDGIQDIGENGIKGVILELLNAEGKVVSTTLTNDRGEYAFNQFNTLDSVGSDRLNEIGLQVRHKYTIRIVNIIGSSIQNPLKKLMLTRVNRGTGTRQDILDSDGAVSGNHAQISLMTGDRGQNNHTYDFGFCPSPSYELIVVKASCDSTNWRVKSNGKIFIKNVQDGDKVSLVKGTVYNGKKFDQAVLISSLINTLVTDTLPNPKADQAYTIRVFNGNDSCFKDTTIILKPNVECTQPCPTAKVDGFATSCDLPTATTANDGRIVLTSIRNITRVAYSKGTTYTGPNYNNAKLSSSLIAGTLVDTLSNPIANQIYTVRLYNLNDSCHTDIQVTLPSIICKTPCDLDVTILETQVYDNKTPLITTDDYVVLDIKTTNTKAGLSGKFVVVCNADSKGQGGDVLNIGGTQYGQSVKVGYNKKLKADGSNINVVIRDIDSPGCYSSLVITQAPPLPDCKDPFCLPMTLTKIVK
jgi:hypothetical protein